MRFALSLWVVGTIAIGLVATGCSGEDGNSCSVTANADGSTTIACEDGTSVTIPPASDGSSCTVTDNGDGTSTIRCEDGTVVIVNDGTDGASCTIVDNGNGTRTITCDDGTRVTIADDEPGTGGDLEITALHGEDFLRSSGDFADGKYFADAVITSATADAGGTVVVNFRVARAGTTTPVVDVPAVSANIVKLVPVPYAPPPAMPPPNTGDLTSKWVAYIYRTETVSGTGYPNPAGTQALQATRENNGTLVNHGDGTYTYTLTTNLSNVIAGGTPITYERNRKHRVSIMMGGHSGPTATATFDFVPDGSTVTLTRDIVRTETCKNCHGNDFHGHGGDRLTVENCVTCHNPGNTDAQGGESLDMPVMIHKIHAGGELPSVAGPDGLPWATADNGEYAIWGNGNSKHTWWKVGFPALVSNCVKCHDGAGADATAWKQRPSRAACGSCHDDIDFTSAADHANSPQTDDNSCTVCHTPDTGLVPLAVVHDRNTTIPDAPLFDDRNLPEFTFDVTMTPPANGTDYRGDEAPVVSIVIRRNGTPLADHRILAGSAQGCKHTASALLCDADTDGRFANSGLFVSGPRAHGKPVLTTAARAQIVSSGTGPFDLSAAGASLILKADQGVALVLDDDWGTRQPGLITVPVSSGTWPGGTSAATTDQIVTWLNANAAFAARALAWNDAGRVAIRSRNKGPVFGLQLQTSAVTTAVFGGDVSIKMPTGSTASNQLTSTTDPKVTRFVDRIEYALDPVTDLVPGTYIINLEVGQLGRVSATDYKTPSVKKVRFNVKQAIEQKPVAGNCDSCHQTDTANGAEGFIVDVSRHNKILDDTAVDQCIACHDYQPQAAADASGLGNWTGARPISRRVHAIHFGASLTYPLRTVDYSGGDPVAGRNWDITFPMDVRNCQSCHPDGETSGTWATEPSRLPCSGCHDDTAAMTHMKINTYDPTPLDPWSGDEEESCKACH